MLIVNDHHHSIQKRGTTGHHKIPSKRISDRKYPLMIQRWFENMSMFFPAIKWTRNSGGVIVSQTWKGGIYFGEISGWDERVSCWYFYPPSLPGQHLLFDSKSKRGVNPYYSGWSLLDDHHPPFSPLIHEEDVTHRTAHEEGRGSPFVRKTFRKVYHEAVFHPQKGR